jgi:predicted RNA-binding Zn ribbon-like protein
VTEPAADDLELLRGFVNTREPDQQIDLLDSPDRLREWLGDHSLLSDTVAITDDAHARAVEFREAIRALAIANGDAVLDEDAVATLNRIAAEVRLSIRVGTDGRAELVPADAGVDEALGHLCAILYTAMIDGSFGRLKACADDTCVWLFYDQSKNRSKKWCEMQTCGNAANARAYRQRRRNEPMS